MINLTEFIGEKLNKPPFTAKKSKQQANLIIPNRRHQKKNQHLFQLSSLSSKPIGFSTILDIQNQEQKFGQLTISRIGNNNNRYRQNRTINRQIHTGRNAKDQLQQMREKRKYLQQKLNHTLTKHEIIQTKFKYRNVQLNQQSKSRGQQSHVMMNQSQSQRQRYQRSQSSIKKYQQNYNNDRYENSHNSSKSFTQNYQRSSLTSSKSQSFQLTVKNKSSLYNQSDRFLNFLKKDIYTLKCQKFIQHFNKFNNKWLIKNINQWIQLNKIIKQEQFKLQRFVFISWKRHVNEQNRKLIMAQMIRKRIQHKRNQPKTVIKEQQTQIVLKEKQKQLQKSLKHQQKVQRNVTPQKDDKIKQNIQDISRASLREISPIKPYKQQFQLPDHEISYYDQYSCITQRQLPVEEEFIK